MARIITLDVELLPERVYLGISEDVPGLVVQMDTIAGVIDEARDLVPFLLEWHEGRLPGELDFVVRERRHDPIAAE